MNELSSVEIEFASALDEAGRPDLGDHVRNSRIHQWIRWLIGGRGIQGSFIAGLHEAMGLGKMEIRGCTLKIAKQIGEEYGVEEGMGKQEVYDLVCGKLGI